MNLFLKYNTLFLFFFFFPKISNGQAVDTATIFTEDAFFTWVRNYHPVMQQAHLLDREALAYQLKARGGFEPKVIGDIQQKSFDGKTYFTIGDTGLKIPTWLGLELKAGYTWTNGIFLNPENNLPAAGQAYAGFTWSLGRGLQFDERRATLEKAKILQNANAVEQKIIINDLLLESGKAYWEWVNAYNNLVVQSTALDLATTRLDGVINSYLQGDKPAIDTLESTIQVQNRQIAVNEAQVIYNNHSRYLSNFLWYQDELPLEVSDLLQPPIYQSLLLENPEIEVSQLVNNLNENHPILQQYQFKLQQLEVDRRLKKEQLKPQVEVSFNFLADGIDFVNRPKDASDIAGIDALFTENYKAGVKVEMPIFLRKAKGDLALTDLKLLNTNYKIRQKRQTLKNKILNYQALLDNTRQQVTINRQAVTNYQSLLQAENEKFRFGESSIFLLNSREQKLITAQLKLIKLLTLYQKNRLGVIWAAGQLE